MVLNNVIAPKFGQRAAKNYTCKKHPKVLMMSRFHGKLVSFFVKSLLEKRYFLKLAGQVCGVGKITRDYGDIFYPTLDNNIVNELVENGLVTVKTVMSNNRTTYIQNLVVLQNKAKPATVGRWDPNAKNTAKKNNFIDEPFFKKNSKTRIKAVV
ncbi:unnamed protein product [Macrosiphum euphorbiae]|uniref:TNase-like domain-containing protein n=1 Tax=Macrosiphum euphorbiae TaxID=13131 RepID=A0AAV0VKZ2_9HEMI|nr:unnamed protein product [Macrosiphum euphorbiae]